MAAVVINRYEEFCVLRKRFNNEPVNDMQAAGDSDQPQFMRKFFDDVAQVQKSLAAARAGANQIEKIRFDALQCVTKQQEDAVSARLNDVLLQTNKSLTFAKTKMDNMKSEEETADIPQQQVAIRSNMYAALIRKFSDVVKDFHNQEELYRKEVDDKAKRQLKLACPDKSEAEITSMLEQGQDTAQVVKQKMGGTHVSVLDALNRVQDKYKDVRRLEKSMQELNQMYIDMAKLVEYQGEMVDSIAHSVTAANANIVKGETELKQAHETMKKKRKLMCASTVCVVIVAVLGYLIIKNFVL